MKSTFFPHCIEIPSLSQRQRNTRLVLGRKPRVREVPGFVLVKGLDRGRTAAYVPQDRFSSQFLFAFRHEGEVMEVHMVPVNGGDHVCFYDRARGCYVVADDWFWWGLRHVSA